jgi:hypothetical protein
MFDEMFFILQMLNDSHSYSNAINAKGEPFQA